MSENYCAINFGECSRLAAAEAQLAVSDAALDAIQCWRFDVEATYREQVDEARIVAYDALHDTSGEEKETQIGRMSEYALGYQQRIEQLEAELTALQEVEKASIAFCARIDELGPVLNGLAFFAQNHGQGLRKDQNWDAERKRLDAALAAIKSSG